MSVRTLKCRLSIALPIALAAAAAGGSAWARELRLPDSMAPAVVKVAHGHVILLESSDSFVPEPGKEWVTVLDATGREVLRRAIGLDTPGTTATRIDDAALTAAGVLVVTVTLWSEEGRVANVLAEYDIASGRHSRTIRIDPHGCLRLAEASGGGVWCLGGDVEKQNAKRHDFDVVLRFSLAGDLERSLLPRSELALSQLAPRGETFPQLISAGDRAAAWLPGNEALLSWSQDGGAARRIALSAQETPDGVKPDDELAFGPGGRIVVLRTLPGSGPGWREMRRAFFAVGDDGTLTRVATSPAEFPLSYRVAGIDGDEVVLWDRGGRRLVWQPLD